MPRKWLKRISPDREKIQSTKILRFFGPVLMNAHLWHMNRRSVRVAFAVGLFCSFIPIPFQMFLATAMAIIVSANLPLSIALVWISNPITMPPIFYFCYWIGTVVLNKPVGEFQFEASWQWLVNSLQTIGPTFLLGCIICAVVSAILGFFLIDLWWRISVVQSWIRRKK